MLVQHTPNAWVYTLLICGVGSRPFTLAQNNCSPPSTMRVYLHCTGKYIVHADDIDKYLSDVLVKFLGVGSRRERG